MKNPTLAAWRLGLRLLPVMAVALGWTGCATAPLPSARESFYRGRFAQAEQALATDKDVAERDRVLFLMERGTVRQALGEYEASAKDYIAAADLIDQLEAYSVSKNAASFVVNDNVQNFRGVPYERTLLHVFTALDHIALANWDNAAVEARRILESLTPAKREEYPEDAFSRYMTGFCFEMIDDPSNASIQYRRASELLRTVAVDEKTGRPFARPPAPRIPVPVSPPGQTNAPAVPVPPPPPPPPPVAPPLTREQKEWGRELVCFVLLGRAGGYEPWTYGATDWGGTYAEIQADGRALGRSYTLADTGELARLTAKREAARKALKTGARIVVKEVIAETVAQSTDNEALGQLVRMILLGLLEEPDVRRWETLPGRLQVARVPCPPDAKEFRIVLKNSAGTILQSRALVAPVTRRRAIAVTFFRDLPPAVAPPPPVEKKTP